jgi:DNA (cytosine-5)-methyltransferase 1
VAAYYNENDAKTAAWLRELIAAKLIADGEVDERDIRDVRPGDLRGFVQCHFFAGIGGWSYALRLAGWADDRAVWTGSCPCQPWSAAGQGLGEDDPRHLWPAWFRLIQECRPATVFGEQVADGDGLHWLDLVFHDLEAQDYACGASDISGACLGSPDIRPRLWFVADADGRDTSAEGLQRRRKHGQQSEDGGLGWLAEPAHERHERVRTARGRRDGFADGGATCGLADAEGGDGGLPVQQRGPHEEGAELERCGEAGELGDTDREGRAELGRGREQSSRLTASGLLGGFWADAEWIYCTDDKYRPVEPGTFPLAHGLPARMVRIRGYGNAIKPYVAAAFIQAFKEATQ